METSYREQRDALIEQYIRDLNADFIDVWPLSYREAFPKIYEIGCSPIIPRKAVFQMVAFVATQLDKVGIHPFVEDSVILSRNTRWSWMEVDVQRFCDAEDGSINVVGIQIEIEGGNEIPPISLIVSDRPLPHIEITCSELRTRLRFKFEEHHIERLLADLLKDPKKYFEQKYPDFGEDGGGE